MRVTPTIGTIRTPRQAEELLEVFVKESERQRRAGKVPPLGSTRVVYKRDPRERWRTAIDTYVEGVGDCDQLAVWLAADLRARGLLAFVKVRFVRPGLYHAVVAVPDARGVLRMVDPSKARGMRGRG